ncbi:MAG TPA: hypothetical protein VGD66_11235 [Allosphingosinicella sp.]|jgi:hypothetical protein
MRDEIDSRMWVEHHEAFSSQVASLFAAAGEAFRRLNAIQFDAPWQRPAPPPQA